MDILFENNTKDDIRKAAELNALILLPVGILEEHGSHLPVNTDNVIAYDISVRVARVLNETIPTMVLPCIWAGYHGKELENIPGSIRVKPETLYHYTYDIVESLVRNGFKKIAMINGHGQNPAILQMVARAIANDFDVNPILTYAMGMIGKDRANEIRTSPEGGCGGHADEVETSLVLALRGELVDMSKAESGDLCTYKSRFFGGDSFPMHSTIGFGYYSTWALQGSKTGVLGEPKYATKDKGDLFLEAIVENYADLLTEYYYLENREVSDNG